jgi:hypothetical protein
MSAGIRKELTSHIPEIRPGDHISKAHPEIKSPGYHLIYSYIIEYCKSNTCNFRIYLPLIIYSDPGYQIPVNNHKHI